MRNLSGRKKIITVIKNNLLLPCLFYWFCFVFPYNTSLSCAREWTFWLRKWHLASRTAAVAVWNVWHGIRVLHILLKACSCMMSLLDMEQDHGSSTLSTQKRKHISWARTGKTRNVSKIQSKWPKQMQKRNPSKSLSSVDAQGNTRLKGALRTFNNLKRTVWWEWQPLALT